MAIAPGNLFGHYEIIETIGAGGMGEVWRATDTNLKREVALKVLPAAFVADADRLARFRREAEILASLNHPNIAQVFGLEKSEGQTAIVMELVEGPTLADRLKKGPLPPEEAIGIALQVIAALEAAHEKQIVHRDLKPANVKVRDDGTVKVLDFGISKPIDPAAISGASPVMTTPAVTQTGIILGTAAYMSPEQARGKFVDQRTDIWAFGCLMFEMLTGQPAFGGEDVMLTLARVLDRATDLSSIPKTISPAVRHTLKLCLEKDPNRRIADIRDVKLALEGSFESGLPAGDMLAADAAPPWWRRAFVPAAALGLGLLLMGAVAWWLRPEPALPEVTRFQFPLASGLVNHSIDWSDDGARFVYIGANPRAVYVRDLDEFAAVPVAATLGEEVNAACLSPDGASIVYASNRGELRRAQINGGASRSIARNLANLGDCDWAEDGNIYVGAGDGGILRVGASGGAVETIVAPDREALQLLFGYPQLLPGGTKLLFTAAGGANNQLSVSVLVYDLQAQTLTTLIEVAGLARYVPSFGDPLRGHIVYGQNGALIAAPFDPSDLWLGEETPVVEGLSELLPDVITQSALSPTGSLAYVSAGDSGFGATGAQALLLVDRMGMPSALTDGMVYTPLAVSEAAGLVATSALDSLSANVSADLWLVDIGGNREPARLAVEGLNIEAVWTPDSSRLLYFHADNLAQLLAGTNLELQSIAVDRSEAPLTLAEMTDLGRSWTLSAVSPDGSYAVGSWARTGTQSVDIWLLALDGLGDGNLATLDDLQFPLESGADEFDPAISPDGRWIAYSSDETGRHEIHVRRFPDFTGNYVVSLDGGTQPIWHPEGEELFYVSQGRMMVVRYASADTFDHEDPSVLFENPDLLRIASETATRAYGYHAATDRFVVNAPTGNAGPGQGVELSIVRNFASELAELAPWPERKL